MKFLCQNCKAKYQISDTKVVGRTLRMSCRRCGTDIIIRGSRAPDAPKPSTATGAPQQLPAMPGVGGGFAAPPAPPSALGADFRNLQRGAPPDLGAARPTALDQWHVGINEVPVGPIRREEISRKIRAGAIKSDSLVWREGFDDWRPLSEVPELLALYRQHSAGPARRTTPPVPARPAMAQPPPGRLPPTGRVPSGSLSAQAAAAQRSNVVPIGGRLGATAVAPMPAISEMGGTEQAESGRTLADLPALDEDAVSSMPVAVEATAALEEAPRSRVAIPVPVLALSIGAGCFGIALAFLLVTQMKGSDESKERIAKAPTAAEPEPTAPAVDPEAVGEEPEAVEEEPAVPEEPAQSAKKARATKKAGGSGKASDSKQASKTGSSKQRDLIERFGGGGSMANINVRDKNRDKAGAAQGRGLSARQLVAVVKRSQPSLNRCYTRAIRGMSDPPSARIDVDFTVGTNGRVSKVRVRGSSFGELSSCVAASVRRWSFPPAGAPTPSSFPLVFSPGA